VHDQTQNVPTHIAFILDGNRRWARAKGLPVFKGHRKGYDAVKEVAVACTEAGAKYMSVYAFSTENWKRSGEEVSYLMDLFLFMCTKDIGFALKHGIKLRFMGRRDNISTKLRKAIENAERKTADQTKGTLAICIDYGGQQEIADAARRCVEDGLSPDEVTPDAVAARLYDPDIPPIDMLVRTSGEQRISNFMLWRAAYSELMFVKKYWPEMTKSDVTAIIEEYSQRSRRFGG
jgi:undecaprenyl diphosphate synthase